MVCHEVWSFNDDGGLATIAGFTVVCPECSLVHHMGKALQLGRETEAMRHMAIVNHMNPEETAVLVREAFATRNRRSRRKWSVIVASDLLARFPELALLDGRKTDPTVPISP
jgi:hypothetical protein